ncbi:MAG: AI-2E family transporter, partial [Xanthomonadales bacterium]|nr:AI-2E family transporter [Xanthomonadales bacterium]
IIGFAVVYFFGRILAPLLTAVIIAYLLEGVVLRLERLDIRRTFGVGLVFLGFLVVMFFIILGVVPVLSRQVTQFVAQLPRYIERFQELMTTLPQRYPQLITESQLNELITSLNAELAAIGQKIVTSTLSSVTSIIAFMVFVVLVPILVFFLMKDKHKIIDWLKSYLPKDRHLAASVWSEVDAQIGNYVRGKTLEILIVGLVTYVTFAILNLQYAILLSTLVGFSVLIPYIGAAVVTIPIAIVGFFQFGWTGDFAWVIFAYGIIQLLDGNVLVPLLFSEVVDLHPVAIIVAVLLFGGMWGFWGVFFAIPLATLVNSVMRSLPATQEEPEVVTPDSDEVDLGEATEGS